VWTAAPVSRRGSTAVARGGTAAADRSDATATAQPVLASEVVGARDHRPLAALPAMVAGDTQAWPGQQVGTFKRSNVFVGPHRQTHLVVLLDQDRPAVGSVVWLEEVHPRPYEDLKPTLGGEAAPSAAATGEGDSTCDEDQQGWLVIGYVPGYITSVVLLSTFGAPHGIQGETLQVWLRGRPLCAPCPAAWWRHLAPTTSCTRLHTYAHNAMRTPRRSPTCAVLLHRSANTPTRRNGKRCGPWVANVAPAGAWRSRCPACGASSTTSDARHLHPPLSGHPSVPVYHHPSPRTPPHASRFLVHPPPPDSHRKTRVRVAPRRRSRWTCARRCLRRG